MADMTLCFHVRRIGGTSSKVTIVCMSCASLVFKLFGLSLLADMLVPLSPSHRSASRLAYTSPC
eukprot:14587529-Alexandrium_andersonii.AAC.1